MIVMQNHEWCDHDVESVTMRPDDTREIVLCKESEGSLLINEKDAIAIAKEFGLVVYRRDSEL